MESGPSLLYTATEVENLATLNSHFGAVKRE